MKKRFFSLVLALCLCAGLATPALADMGYVPLDTSPEWLEWKNTWAAEHPDLMAAFDPDLWFEQHYTDYYASQEAFMELSELSTREEFDAQMVQAWLQNIRFSDEQIPAARDYAAAHPEAYAAFDPDAWVVDSWYNDRAGYKTMWQVDDATFEDHMWVEYTGGALALEEAAQVVEDYRAAHPGELEGLDLDGLLAVLGYQDPWKGYMEDYGLTTLEEAQTELLRTYVVHRNALAEVRAQAEAYRAANPESWESFDAEGYFEAGIGSWYDKESYMADNWLLTEEEFADQLYAEYMTWGALSTPNPWPADGSPILMVNGASREDIALTAEAGVSYLTPAEAQALFGGDYAGESVPLRAAAEEAGWDVVWNSYRNQIVLMNQDQLFQDLGLDFSGFDALMNRVLSLSAPEPGQSYRTTQTAKLSFTAFNSLDGDKTYTATVKADTISRDNVYDLTLTVKAADLLGLVPPSAMAKLTAEMPQLTLKDLKTLFSGLELHVLLDLEAGTLAWNCPFLAVFDETVSEDDWHTLNLGTSDSLSINPALDALASGTWDTGAFLYADLLRASGEGVWGASYAYYNFVNSTSTLMLLFGPGTVTEQNGGITWSMDTETMNDMLAQLMTEMSYDQDWSDLTIFKEYDLSISIDKSGKMSSSMACRLDMDALATAATSDEWYDAGTTTAMAWVFGLLDCRMAFQSEGTAAKSTGTAEFHWKNQFKLEIETASTRKETDEAPRTLPD